MVALADALHGLLRLPGATYACVVERDSGRVLAEIGRGEGGAGDGEGVVPNSVVRWGTALAAMFRSTSGDELDDVMITGRRSYHLVRSVDAGSSVLAYVRLDRTRANLAAARRELASIPWHDGGGPQTPPPARITAPEGPPSLTFPTRRGPTPGGIPLPRRTVNRVAAEWPRRPVVPPAPGEVPAAQAGPAAPSVLDQRWARDPRTLRRLIAGLRRMS